MSRICYLFFITGALMALAGMGWGLSMAITGDFAMRPAHAHLNLVGWATLGLMGAFYGLAGARVPKVLAMANYAFSTVGVLMMIPSLAMELQKPGTGGIALKVSPILVMVGMVCFIAAVAIAGLRARRTGGVSLGGLAPAE